MRGPLPDAWPRPRPTAPARSNASSGKSVLGVVGNVFCFGGIFNLHIAELLGVKNLATLQTLDKFRVFVPGDDSHFGVSAGAKHRSSFQLKSRISPAESTELARRRPTSEHGGRRKALCSCRQIVAAFLQIQKQIVGPFPAHRAIVPWGGQRGQDGLEKRTETVVY